MEVDDVPLEADDENVDTSNRGHHQHAKRGGGMRRVDSLELHRARLPESARRGSRRKSQLGAPEKANAPGGTFSGGLLSLLGLGSSPAAVLRS